MGGVCRSPHGAGCAVWFELRVSIRCMNADELLRRARLGAQRLTPTSACASVEEAARAVIGVQAQDLRASALALRSRVPGLTRSAIRSAPLVRTWTVRGTVHLIAASDRPWLHALLAERNARTFGARFERLGVAEQIRAMRSDVVDLCAERPRDRASLLRALIERGHPSLEQGPINTFVPWLSTQGLIVTDTAGLLHPADPPPAVEHDEALAILGARYRAGYGPCDAADLAKWSSLPLAQARRALQAAGPAPAADGWPRDDPPPCLLLAAFDTLMLGHRTREPFVAAEHDHHVLKGGGMLRPVALTRGSATGTWSIKNGRPHPTWFGQPAPSAAFFSEATDIERFLSS
jgi:Winged helix DNA-binding domain